MSRFPQSSTGVFCSGSMLLCVFLIGVTAQSGCSLGTEMESYPGQTSVKDGVDRELYVGASSEPSGTEEKTMSGTVTFGSGCFWCTEAVFQRLRGVEKVVSGYMGGHQDNPTYNQICQGNTGHAEVIQVQYDPQKIQFEELLEVFWKTHDPTTLNRQGADIGTHYRSAIFYHADNQKELAEAYKKKLDEAAVFDNPIVTEITPATTFFPAEEYHQDYYNLNPYQGYCSVVIRPKIEKLEKVFADKLKATDDSASPPTEIHHQNLDGTTD